RSLHTDFIMITGNKTIQSVIHSRWLGAFSLFFKPADPDTLLNEIHVIFDRACIWEKRLKEAGGLVLRDHETNFLKEKCHG
ncbi:MAG: hypothetical protein HQK77_10850, partial [Desulfobacterales bacterium]|nr:hypothetical protein [Desulfobacterales bacterium]